MGFFIQAGSLAVLHLVLRGSEGVGVVGAVVVADGESGVSSAETVVVIAAAARVQCRLLRNADVQDTGSTCISVCCEREPSMNKILRLSSANRSACSHTRSSAGLSSNEAQGSSQNGESGELHG
jgi:hypothetical protein